MNISKTNFTFATYQQQGQRMSVPFGQVAKIPFCLALNYTILYISEANILY